MISQICRTLILYILIIFAIRLMGKRQISELQTTELVITLLISNIASIPMENPEQPLFSGLIPIFILVAFEILISVIMLKKTKFRRLLCGKPIIVISNGKIVQENLKKLRMTIDDLFEELRQDGIFSLSDVEFAIVETNGLLSIMKKHKKDSVTREDLKIKSPDNGIEVVVVSDGNISEFSCKICGINETIIDNYLSKSKTNLKDVFILLCDQNHNFTLIRKDKK